LDGRFISVKERLLCGGWVRNNEQDYGEWPHGSISVRKGGSAAVSVKAKPSFAAFFTMKIGQTMAAFHGIIWP
jgi:hypothetical protein